MTRYHVDSPREVDQHWRFDLTGIAAAPVDRVDTPECSARFREAGFAVVDGLFTAAEIREIAKRVENYRQHVAPHHPRQDWVRKEPDGAVGNMYSIEQIDPFFHDLGTRPDLLAAVARLTGHPMRFGSVESFDKPPFSGSAAIPHQDGIYFEGREERQVHIWLPLEAATRENGAMIYWPGSQRHGLFDHYRITDDAYLVAIPDELLVPLGPPNVALVEPTQAVIHGDRVVHASNPNSSANGRTALAISYFRI